MSRLHWSLVLVVVLAAAGGVSPVEAQSSKYYRPPRPTFSPWFNLFQKNTGPLDNYHSFVRPEQRLFKTLQNQGTAIEQQRTQMGTLGQQVTQLERPSTVRPTGTGSTFMNYSHYYPSGGASAGGGGSSRSWSPPPASSGGGMGGGGGF